jgi:hypothetical protein
VLIDLERFAFGHPETDLPVTATEYLIGWHADEQYANFFDAYGFDVCGGYDLIAWPGFPVVRAINEPKMTTWLMQNIGESDRITAEFRTRLESLRDPDAPCRWKPFQAGGKGGLVTWRSVGAPSPGEGDGKDIEARDAVEVPEVGCPDAPSGRDRGRCDEPVVRPDVLAGGGELGPDAGVRAGGEEAEGHRRECGQDCLDEGLAADPVLRGGAVHAVQQLSSRDGGDPDFLVRPQLLLEPAAHLGHGAAGGQAPGSALKVDEDGGI